VSEIVGPLGARVHQQHPQRGTGWRGKRKRKRGRKRGSRRRSW